MDRMDGLMHRSNSRWTDSAADCLTPSCPPPSIPPRTTTTKLVWMEVDVSHPAVFEREDQQQQQQLRLAEWRRDLAGNPRFCCWEL